MQDRFLHFRRARCEEAGVLSALALAAKASWGYPASWLDLWKTDLCLTPAQIEDAFVLVGELQGRAVGFVCISTGGDTAGDRAEIEHMWVGPEFMGRGIGRSLLVRALAWCRARAIAELTVVSDPNARGFYEALGGQYVGEEPSIPAPRALPVLKFFL